MRLLVFLMLALAVAFASSYTFASSFIRTDGTVVSPS